MGTGASPTPASHPPVRTERALRSAVLIPAFNEARTVARVVDVALRAGVGPVLVVDDGSADATAAAARAAGARVRRLGENGGKGAALAAGARTLDAEVLLLLDADLTGLRPEHLHALLDPVVSGRADMARGVFAGGRWRTTAAQRLAPQLNGQRAVRREALLSVPGLERSRYGVEVAITAAARRGGWRVEDVPLEGVSQVMKEEKRGLVTGLRVRARMYREILAQVLRRDRRSGRGR